MVADISDHSGTGLAIRSVDADLDEFVMGQGLIDFGQYGFGETGIADDDHRLERMAEAAQVTFLAFVELHVRGLASGARSIAYDRGQG